MSSSAIEGQANGSSPSQLATLPPSADPFTLGPLSTLNPPALVVQQLLLEIKCRAIAGKTKPVDYSSLFGTIFLARKILVDWLHFALLNTLVGDLFERLGQLATAPLPRFRDQLRNVLPCHLQRLG